MQQNEMKSTEEHIFKICLIHLSTLSYSCCCDWHIIGGRHTTFGATL